MCKIYLFYIEIKKSDRGRKSISVFSDIIKRNINQVVTLRDSIIFILSLFLDNYNIWSICNIKSENKVDIIWENNC